MDFRRIVQDLSREFSAKFLELSGREHQAQFLRKLRDDKTVFLEAWGKPTQVKSSVLDVMDFTGKLVLSSYLDDLLSEPLNKLRPQPDESFMRWALRARVNEQVDFLLSNMPFNIDSKWELITSIVEHSGFKLHPTTHCFK